MIFHADGRIGAMKPIFDSICAVLWDMDGVLADTGELHFAAWSATLAEEGIPFDWETFRSTFGMNNTGILTTLLGRPPDPDYVLRISDRKEQACRQAMRGHIQLLDGVEMWLKRLQKIGCRQAVASSAPPENITALVDELDIGGYFDTLVSAFSMPGKPDPAVFLEAARRLAMPPERCIVVEDSIAGVEAAKRAGMRCIAVTNTNPRAALAQADMIVDSLADLPEDAFASIRYE